MFRDRLAKQLYLTLLPPLFPPVDLTGLSSDEEECSPTKQTFSESPRKDQSRLSFVITSDDGFKVEADSIEGGSLLKK